MESRSRVRPIEQLEHVEAYYERELGYIPDAEKLQFFSRAIQNGLTFNELWAAIDYALSVCGYGAHERDYWPHIQKEARRIWKEVKKEKAAP